MPAVKVTKKASAKPAAKPAARSREAAPISDAAVQKATGKTWPEWYALLDKAGCARMTHKEIVAVVGEHFPGPWWGQMVTVEYERARGLRDKYQKTTGYAASGSRVIAAPIDRLYKAVSDTRTRKRWLPDALTIRKATENKSLRITWTDGSDVTVNFYGKGEAKAQITIDHQKLPDARASAAMKSLWAAALDRLKTMLEK
ncbi:MAG: hypothetical protein ACKV2V_23590 [Blastocatellia bacterium]